MELVGAYPARARTPGLIGVMKVRALRSMRSAELEIVPDAGHMLYVDRPEKVRSPVLESATRVER